MRVSGGTFSNLINVQGVDLLMIVSGGYFLKFDHYSWVWTYW